MDAKPPSGQQYPFIYYRTARGVEVLLDDSCPEVIKDLRDLVAVEAVELQLPHQFVLSVPESFPLSAQTNLVWDAYQWEHKWEQIATLAFVVPPLGGPAKDGTTNSPCPPLLDVHLESAWLGILRLDLSRGDQILCLHQVAMVLSRRMEAYGSGDSPITRAGS